MQVNSVSNNSFGQSMSARRAILEGFANLDDNELKQIARNQASVQLNQKKHNRVNNMLYWSLPVAAGVAAVAANPAKAVKVVEAAGETAGKALSPLMKNLGTFGKTALGWTGALAFFEALFAGRNLLAQKSEKVRNFDRQHPVISVLTSTSLAIADAIFGGKALHKHAPNISYMISPKLKTNVAKTVGDFIGKVDDKIVNSKVLGKISNGIAKVPSAIKNAVNFALQFGPLALVSASIVHSTRFANAKSQMAAQNYAELKEAQAEIREALDKNDEAAEV